MNVDMVLKPAGWLNCYANCGFDHGANRTLTVGAKVLPTDKKIMGGESAAYVKNPLTPSTFRQAGPKGVSSVRFG